MFNRNLLSALVYLFLGLALYGCGGSGGTSTTHYRGVIDNASVNPVFIRFDLNVGTTVTGQGELHERSLAVRTGELSGSVVGEDEFGNKQIEFYFEDNLGETLLFKAIHSDEQIHGTYSTVNHSSLNQSGTFTATAYNDKCSNSRFDSLHVRRTLTDYGSLPYTYAAAAQSPDIIPYGTSPIADPETLLGSASYDRDLGKSLLDEMQNYLYVRAKNLGSEASTGKLYLYYAPLSLSLTPNKWMNNPLRTPSGVEYVEFNSTSPDNVAVAPNPFVFVPQENSSGYSLIARLSTSDNPNPITPNFGNIQDFIDWVETNEIAFRSIIYGNNNAPVVSKTIPAENPGQSSENCQFRISTSNIPIGSFVQFSAATPLPDGNMIDLPKTIVSTNPFMAGVTATLPAGYSTYLQVSVFSNGNSFPEGSEVTLSQYLIADSSGEREGLQGVGFQTHKLGLVGEVTIRFTSND